MPIDRLVLFQKQKSSNRMRSQSHKARHPAPEHPTDAFVLDGPAQQPQQALRLFRAHDPRLDHVDGTAHRRRHEAREQGRREVRRQVILERGVREQDPFETIVARELAGRHQHGPHAVRPYAPPQAPPAFFPRHPDQPVYSVLVVSPLVDGKSGVVLHAHVEDIGWVAGYPA